MATFNNRQQLCWSHEYNIQCFCHEFRSREKKINAAIN